MAIQSTFQPTPPVRTSTVDSQNTQGSGQMSPPTSPALPSRTATASPTEDSFFGAITARMRRDRSRSASRRRDKSPMVMPPVQVPSTTTQPRQATKAAQPSRPSLQSEGRRSTSGSDPWRGRHSNDWLFNGFSVTDTARDIFRVGRKS
ncbi:hypothetical protein P153DRAFT_371149 [Dothidotthia symphoricarpi CBS 119687]|uniref:Uncharacterized protein n=1 Tax=Dothidotthia symphoricarpi CBS 119687 TaxID=1392245 RepID=A0A6A5ZZH3_9PLEO|nr:uncharacterized protein P153DRAFT_371149 [Dothidotthia symphoricarpi CBS 119687]KAF2124294.1 hypothetical protein P153DRAFT_371149 [Dothidotthia symphoricarpi CBS 119687]